MEIGIKKIQINKYIKYSLIIIVLNILDLALTYIGVTNNWAKEINPLLEPYVTDLYIMSGLKIAMPLILFGYIAIRLQYTTIKQILRTIRYLRYLLYFYIVVNLIHLSWIVPVIYVWMFIK